VRDQEHKYVAEQADSFPGRFDKLDIRSPDRKKSVETIFKARWPAVELAIDERDRS